jgi:cephalosporin hydroxylase
VRSTVLLILGRGRKLETTRTFDAYQHLVGAGSYVIVEDTVLNGHPAEPEFGPGPREAVKTILRSNGDFIADPKMERLGLTFNPDGYLLRRTGP